MHLKIAVLAGLAALAVAACSGPEPVASDERASGAVLWPELPPEAHAHVNRRLDQIESSPPLQGGALFVGDSITEAAPLHAMFPNLRVANHGIAWDTSDGVLLRLGQITQHAPYRLFLKIGTNDTDYTDDDTRISDNIFEIVSRLNEALPVTEIYVVSVLPRGGAANDVITALNQTLQQNPAELDYVYLDLASAMRADNGELRSELTYDNLHLNVHGYAVWETALHDCVWHGCADGLADEE